jgi:hypothetical protein
LNGLLIKDIPAPALVGGLTTKYAIRTGRVAKEFFMNMKRKLFNMALVLPAITFLAAGCATSTNYLHVITPHTAADLLADNVQVFEGRSYDEAAVLAAEAGYEVILSYEGRGRQGLFAMNASVRLIAQDKDGIRPAAGK